MLLTVRTAAMRRGDAVYMRSFSNGRDFYTVIGALAVASS